MADNTQTLREFTQNLVSDVSSGTISVEEAMAAASQYSYLREELGTAALTLSQAAIAGDEELTKAFLALFATIDAKLAELPSFQSQQPDRPSQEKEVRDVGHLQKEAVARLRQSSRSYTPSRRRAFIHDLVTRFSSTVPTLSDSEIAPLMDRAVVSAASADPASALDRVVEHLTYSIEDLAPDVSADQRATIASAVDAAVTNQRDAIKENVQATKRGLDTYVALVRSENLARPDVFVDVMLNAPASETPTETLTRADKLARMAHTLEHSAGKQGGKLQFFSANAAKGVFGGLQKGADGILSLVGEPVREMILHEKVNGTLRSMFRSTQAFTDRLGETFVRSALFTHIAQDLTRQLAEKPRGGQVRTVFDDLFTSVFRGPLSPALQGPTREGILDYFELSRANAAAPKGRSFLPPGIFPWDVFRVFEGTSSRASPRLRFGFPLLGFGSFGSFISNTLSAFVDRLTSFALINPRLPRQLSASRRAAAIPVPLSQDMPLLVALVVIIVILLFFVFPSPLNLTQISHSSKVSALLAALQNTKDVTGGLLAEVTTFRCEWNGPTPPTSPIAACPVHASITQGPFTPGQSHATANAYDFGASQGTPVVSGHDAFIVSYNNSYAPNQYRYGSYGNNVVLVATDPSTNQQYCTNYAHLLDVAPVVAANAGQPAVIQAGTVIGYVDTTGYTYGCIGNQCGEGFGTHLHWGYKGVDPRKPFLPPGCP